jgi:hypothetical protein
MRCACTTFSNSCVSTFLNKIQSQHIFFKLKGTPHIYKEIRLPQLIWQVFNYPLFSHFYSLLAYFDTHSIPEALTNETPK